MPKYTFYKHLPARKQSRLWKRAYNNKWKMEKLHHCRNKKKQENATSFCEEYSKKNNCIFFHFASANLIPGIIGTRMQFWRIILGYRWPWGSALGFGRRFCDQVIIIRQHSQYWVNGGANIPLAWSFVTNSIVL